MSDTLQIPPETLATVADTVLATWKQHHGTDVGEGYAINGSRHLVVFLENVLSQAEQTVVTQNHDTTLLASYVEQVLEQVCVDSLIPLTKITQYVVKPSSTMVDLPASSAICVFKLNPGVIDND